MSALNAFVTPEAVHLFTDAGLYDPGSVELKSVSPKVSMLPQYDAVIGFTGPGFMHSVVPISITAAPPLRSYEELVEKFPDIVRAAIEQWRGHMGPTSWGEFEMVLAGWSEANGPSAHHLCGYAKDGWPAFRYREVSRFRAPDHLSLVNNEFDPKQPVASGLDLMRRQRDIKVGVATANDPTNSNEGYRVVHGFCQYTRVDAGGIHTKILQRWPV